ncbi:MAG: hypothetical protein HY681_15345 [Chloroflexi bacterium]|nr:hypothetical protein [Chloroflexota bacterium]
MEKGPQATSPATYPTLLAMQPKDLTDKLWAGMTSDSWWDGMSDAERVDDTTIIAMPFDGQPITIQVRQAMATKKYDVHLFTVVRVKLEGIEAGSQREAIKKAEERFHQERIGDALGLTRPIGGTEAEYAEEIVDYLVDESGDPGYELSRRYRPEELEQSDLEQTQEEKEANHEMQR